MIKLNYNQIKVSQKKLKMCGRWQVCNLAACHCNKSSARIPYMDVTMDTHNKDAGRTTPSQTIKYLPTEMCL